MRYRVTIFTNDREQTWIGSLIETGRKATALLVAKNANAMLASHGLNWYAEVVKVVL